MMNQELLHDFPLLKKTFLSGEKLVYLDNASTTLKPEVVIQRISDFYAFEYSNVHRGVYPLAEKAGELYKNARLETLRFLKSEKKGSIVFTSGTTDSINLVATSFLLPRLKQGDEVIISRLEHHSNWIPWQQICIQKGATLRIMELDKLGQLDWKNEEYWTDKVKFIALTQVSNVTGMETPFEEIIYKARKRGIPILIDGAQAILTKNIDLGLWDPDFYVFSAHKALGPMGVGVLYLKEGILDKMSPIKYGGGMVKKVGESTSFFKKDVGKFEAGTPNVSGVLGMVEAFRYLQKFSKIKMIEHISQLGQEFIQRLKRVKDIHVYSRENEHSGIISFSHKKIHPHDLATFLGQMGICVRAGHHCAQPLMEYLDTPATIRASFSIYNTYEDVNQLEDGIKEAIKFFNYG